MGLFDRFIRGDVNIERRSMAGSANSQDLEQARGYVTTVAAELKSSAEQQQAALRRVNTLGDTISKLEVELSAMARLQAENKALGVEGGKLKKELSEKTAWASEQEGKLVNLERQHKKTRSDLEAAQAELSARKDSQASSQEKLTEVLTHSSQLKSQLAERSETLSAAQNIIKGLEADIAKQAGTLAAQDRKVLELQKSADALGTKLSSKTQAYDSAITDLKTLRTEFENLKTKYFETNGALDNANYDIQAQKKVFEDSLQRRDDENQAMKARLDQMNTQLRIKDNMGGHAEQEISTLRTTLENERARHDSNERSFREKSLEAERNAQALARAKSEYDLLNEKFSTAMEDIETLRRMNAVQQQKLEQYAAVGGVYAGQSLTPNMTDYSPHNPATDIGEDFIKFGGTKKRKAAS